MDHFISLGPLWAKRRAVIMWILREENRWGDMSYLLGAWSGCKKDGDFLFMEAKPTSGYCSNQVHHSI